ncbi:MAG TPA: HK97 gp10 family phage protein [Bacteroidales bacterium]|nr:HK97 gp10 family phage protein [Bacteroidales bacterium]
MSVTIDQNEFRRLVSNLQRLDTEFKPSTMRKIFIKAARPVITSIKSKVPVLTGALKKSIGVLPFLGIKTGSVYVGVKRDRVKKKVTTFYGRFMEFGSKHIPAGKFTFFEPGVRAALGQSQEVIFRELKSAINKYAGR